MSESTSTKLEPNMTKVESLVTNLRKKAQVYRCVGIYEKEQELLDLAATIVGLECEVDKLRELVRDMWKDYKWATDDLEEPYSKQGEFADRMRELGIEVDE